MTSDQFDRVESKLVESIEYLSERTATAAEVEALAAVVQALSKFVTVRQLAQGDL